MESEQIALPQGAVSPRLATHTRIEHGLRARMRDGVELAVDLMRPELSGSHPVLLMRTPYDKVRIRTQREPFLRDLAERGYVVAIVDCRGRFNSDGVFRPYFDEADDGYDTIEWIAKQPWCDGNVGMFGGSYAGQNQWLALPDWPPQSESTSFYLHSRGRANTLLGDGILSTEPPDTEPEDSYRYDPLDPVRTSWSIHEGPVDDRVATIRSDVLCYTSEPLGDRLDVIGWASVRLCASSSALDTDWHVRLCDVYPDGSARFLCHGVLRARFRESFERPVPLKPETPTMFEITMAQPLANRFLPGHRIRLEVTSSWFDLFDRNLNSGAKNPFFDEEAVVATQRIYHRRGLASELMLPIAQR